MSTKLPDVPLLKGALGAAPVARGVDETHLDSDLCFSRSHSCCEGPRILLGKPSGAEAEMGAEKRAEARRVFSDQRYVMRQTRSGVEMDFRAAFDPLGCTYGAVKTTDPAKRSAAASSRSAPET